MTTFEKAKAIRTLIVKKAMEGMVYSSSWSPEFRIKEIDAIPEILKKWEISENESFSIDPSDLTYDECKELGFGLFSEGDASRLIPIWLFPFLKEEFDASCIDGTYGHYKKSEMDTDHRFGYLAYGIYPKDFVPKENVSEAVNILKI